jgi:Family of unknown function (DUF6298)
LVYLPTFFILTSMKFIRLLPLTRTATLVLGFLPAMLLAVQRPPVVKTTTGDALEYVADAAGNRLPDFSLAGYGGGGVPLPQVPTRVTIAPRAGDNGARIQAAIDFVSGLKPDARGLRGAVQLEAGRYEIAGQLKIKASGVVLRGVGAGFEGTVLVASGTDRRALIQLRGLSDSKAGAAVAVSDAYVPVGALELHVKDASGLHVGDEVVIARPATADWIKQLGMDVAPGRQQFIWKAPSLTLEWNRVVTAVDGDKVTLDAPLTTALDTKMGGGTVAVLAWPGRLAQVGVENLLCLSAFDALNPLDEQHAWEAVRLDAVRDGWVVNVTAAYFAGSVINIGPKSSRVTVQDCISFAPVSELGGYRRHTFHTDGQQTLFLRCRAEDGRNDFTVGYKAGGPNVFLECSALRSLGFSGSTGSWASGILFDNVTLDGGTLELNNRETWNQGVGWAAANSMLWQCTAPIIICRTPPGAQNWADGVWGQFVGDGYWSQVNEFVRPDSLYRTQLAARLGQKATKALEPLKVFPVAATVKKWDDADNVFGTGIPPVGKPLSLNRGVLTVGGVPLSGREADISWWRGFLLEGVEETKPAITRFAPGMTGPNYTDDLDELTDGMVKAHQVVLRQHYGLWYERRRMDHERLRRSDGDVWPPFYEQPFARSGQSGAWDGLSRYDLTKYNSWYFQRLQEFAGLARQKGLVLVNEMYFQHNIIEAGAHWVDSPWRPVNNINGTKFTEPPPFEGDTVKMADEFYNLSDPAYRALHRAYIRHHLDVLGDETNVIHTLTAENSGPLSFMQFWLDVVSEWERETGKHPLIALSAPKDVQDAILADPVRSAVVDVIDFTYWFRNPEGKEFAPPGGESLAPRQYQRLFKGKRPNAANIAEMAREYRQRFPAKAIITGLGEASDVQPK